MNPTVPAVLAELAGLVMRNAMPDVAASDVFLRSTVKLCFSFLARSASLASYDHQCLDNGLQLLSVVNHCPQTAGVLLILHVGLWITHQ